MTFKGWHDRNGEPIYPELDTRQLNINNIGVVPMNGSQAEMAAKEKVKVPWNKIYLTILLICVLSYFGNYQYNYFTYYGAAWTTLTVSIIGFLIILHWIWNKDE